MALGYHPTGGDRDGFTPEDLALKLLGVVRERVEAVIEREGVFRDPKDCGFFVADVPRGRCRTKLSARLLGLLAWVAARSTWQDRQD